MVGVKVAVRIKQLPVLFYDLARDDVIAIGRVCGDILLYHRRFQQMDLPQFAAQCHQFSELCGIIGVWDAREVDFEELFVGVAVGGGVQHGIDIVEQVDGGEFIRVAGFFRLEGEG